MIAVSGVSLELCQQASEVIYRFPVAFNEIAIREEMRVRLLAPRERYRDVSGELRRIGVDVDQWPVPPAGLFVVAERTVYVRSFSAMTVAHEWSHAIDAALGGGVYLSGYHSGIREAFARARSFVTPYAATGLDEFWAEGLRAYCGINDAFSPWPKATRERLAATNPDLLAIIEGLLATDTAVTA